MHSKVRQPGGSRSDREAWASAKDFCETLAEHVEEFIEQAGRPDAREIGDIYMAYEDGDSRLYELLPDEAKLFA